MASLLLVLVVRVDNIHLGPDRKCADGITQHPHDSVEDSEQNKFRYDDYLAIYSFSLLSNVVGVDARLGEHCAQVGEFKRSAIQHEHA